MTTIVEVEKSYDDFLQEKIESKSTEVDYLIAFGGKVEAPNASIDEESEVTILFSRPIVYPLILMAVYDDSYFEAVPKIELTLAELDELKSTYE